MVLAVIAAAFDFCFAQNQLNEKQKGIIAIAAFTAKGDLTQLAKAFHEGLDAGMSMNETKEELIHLSAYCGFPRSLNAIVTLGSVLDDRKTKGITDPVGRVAMKPADTGKFEKGKMVLEALTGQPEKYPKTTGYAAFVPAIDSLLKEHLFNDIFTRGVISNEERELITISALVSMGGVESQLRGHLGICLHLGFTRAMLADVFLLVENKVGKKEADVGRAVLSEVTAARK
jgi:4-carboxymuconolactone decarboxylase